MCVVVLAYLCHANITRHRRQHEFLGAFGTVDVGVGVSGRPWRNRRARVAEDGLHVRE